jgi:hypothetical protein
MIMYFLRKGIIVLILLALTTGCKYKCHDRNISTAFIGFPVEKIDTILFKRFEKNSNFSTLIDSYYVTNSELNGGLGTGKYTTSNDTTIVFVDDNYPDCGMIPGYDFEVFIPATGKIISISNIVSLQTEGGSSRCGNPIESFMQDGVLAGSPIYFDTDDLAIGYRAYIRP